MELCNCMPLTIQCCRCLHRKLKVCLMEQHSVPHYQGCILLPSGVSLTSLSLQSKYSFTIMWIMSLIFLCSFLLGLHIYHLFGLFWLTNFVLALGEVTLAGGFASWYWSFKKPRDVPTFALVESFGRAIL
jgi:hypothetical protein